jgi:cytochrome c peroxidase
MRLSTFYCLTEFSIICLIAIVTAVAAGRGTGAALLRNGGDDDELLQQAKSLFQPLPKDMATAEFPVTPERVSLGRMLFFDPRISADGTGSCMRCHQPALYGADGLAKSVGVHDKPLPRNAPTVFNAGLYVAQHWDGRFANVEEQAKRALLGPGFGNPDYPTAMARVKAIPGYAAMFQQAFSSTPTSPTPTSTRSSPFSAA